MESPEPDSQASRPAPRKARGLILVIFLLLLVATLQFVTLWRLGIAPECRLVPSFTGAVGEFDEAGDFAEFLDRHDQTIVQLDCLFLETGFSAQEVDSNVLQMTIRTETASVEGTEPDYLDSTGFSILVGSDPASSSMAGFNAGTHFIKGLYEVNLIYGTNHGYSTYQLRPVARENLR